MQRPISAPPRRLGNISRPTSAAPKRRPSSAVATAAAFEREPPSSGLEDVDFDAMAAQPAWQRRLESRLSSIRSKMTSVTSVQGSDADSTSRSNLLPRRDVKRMTELKGEEIALLHAAFVKSSRHGGDKRELSERAFSQTLHEVVGIPHHRAADLFKRIDAANSGSITFDAFVSHVVHEFEMSFRDATREPQCGLSEVSPNPNWTLKKDMIDGLLHIPRQHAIVSIGRVSHKLNMWSLSGSLLQEARLKAAHEVFPGAASSGAHSERGSCVMVYLSVKSGILFASSGSDRPPSCNI
jgi:hypothetical protein